MNVNEKILENLEGQELSVKELAFNLDCSITSLYKPLERLFKEGLIIKRGKEVNGRQVSFYSLPLKEVSGVCTWESHKQILLSGKTYSEKVLNTDYSQLLSKEILNLKANDETFDAVVVGLKGVGKSVAAIWLGSQLNHSFSVDDIIMTKQDLLKVASVQPKDKVLLIDDIGTLLSSRAWREEEREAILGFFQICRQNRVDLIGTTPSLDFVDLNFRRLLRYIWNVQLRCGKGVKGHTHILIHKSFNPGIKSTFVAMGVLTLPYPEDLDPLIKKYQAIKLERLKGTAKESLERIEKAKEHVQQYVLKNPITSITDDVVRSALYSFNLFAISKEDKDKLRTVMWNTLQEKKRLEKRAKQIQKKQGTENLEQGRLQSSYDKKFQEFLTKDYNSGFAEILASRLIYEKEKAINLKGVPSLLDSLLKKVMRKHLEKFILDNFDSPYLARDLIGIRDFFAEFKLFREDFYSKLFLMLRYDPVEAKKFKSMAISWRDSTLYKHHKKFSAKKWRSGVVSHLKDLEYNERQKRVNEKKESMGIAAGVDLADKIGRLFGADLKGKLGVRGDWSKEVEEEKEKPFWGDL